MEDISYTFDLYVAESIFIPPSHFRNAWGLLITLRQWGVGAQGMGSESWHHHFLTVPLWASDSSSVKWE